MESTSTQHVCIHQTKLNAARHWLNRAVIMALIIGMVGAVGLWIGAEALFIYSQEMQKGSLGVAVILYTDWTDPSAEAHGKIFKKSV